MKLPTVKAYGREYCHQQRLSLERALLKDGYIITTMYERGVTARVTLRGKNERRVGRSTTIWLALCEAVNGVSVCGCGTGFCFAGQDNVPCPARFTPRNLATAEVAK